MKQRLGIAAALLGDPELLILDEPTNGLDPVGISEMRDLLVRIAGDDRTVLVSSHLLSELEQICDWLLIIDGGRLVYAGEAARLRRPGRPRDRARPGRRPPSSSPLAELVGATGAGRRARGRRPRRGGRRARPRPLAASLNRAAASSGIVLGEVHVRRPTLEVHLPPPARRRPPMIRAYRAELAQAPPPPGRARRRGRRRVRASAAPPSSSPSAKPRRNRSGRLGRHAEHREAGRAPAAAPRSSATSPFAGTFVFVVFVGVIAVEFSRGTFRTMLLRQPAGPASWPESWRRCSPWRPASSPSPSSRGSRRACRPRPRGRRVAGRALHAAGAAVSDYGVVLVWITGYAVLGTASAVLVRSVPVALAVGIVWAGPVRAPHPERVDAAPGEVFPGLLLEAFAAGGTTAVTAGRRRHRGVVRHDRRRVRPGSSTAATSPPTPSTPFWSAEVHRRGAIR